MPPGDLIIRQLAVGPMENFAYVIGSRSSGECCVVDPAWEPERIVATMEEEGLRLAQIVLSHTHPDHTNGVEALLEATGGVPVRTHRQEAHRVAGIGDHLAPVAGGERIRMGEVELTLIHTPGHTPGSQCVLVEGNLLTGDTLFIGGCGRCDLPGGDPVAMHETLTGRLGSLPDGTRILPGHDYAERPVSNLGDERATNPYLGFADQASFVAYRMRPRR
jgi:hydroxyacylglutathione hydrolase